MLTIQDVVPKVLFFISPLNNMAYGNTYRITGSNDIGRFFGNPNPEAL